MAADANFNDLDYVPRRLGLYRTLLAQPRFDVSTFFEGVVRNAPFRLGESIAEATLPYAVDDVLNDAADYAVGDLVELSRRRKENELEPRKADSASIAEQDTRRLPPPTFSLVIFGEASAVQRAAARASRLDAALDTGVLEAWLSRGYGGPLLEHLANLFTRAVEEDVAAGGATPYLELCLFAALNLSESKKTWAKQGATRHLQYERLEKIVGFAFASVVEAALERALATLAGKSLPFDTQAYALRARAAVLPLAYCSIRNRALQNDMNPWGLSAPLAEQLDALWSGLLDEDPNPRTAESRLVSAIFADDPLKQQAARAAAVMTARRRALDWLAVHDSVDQDLAQALLDVAFNVEACYAQLASPKALVSRVQKFLKGRDKFDKASEAATAALVDTLKAGPLREDLVRDVAGAYVTLALDRVLLTAVDAARGRLRDRRHEFSREQLIADYQAGRLYRLSGDGKELRKALGSKSQGHLFIDLKGFTLRTYRAKELVMAEFLRTEFYEPILNAAANRAGEGRGEKRIHLQNLLGDAAVFSGDVAALLELARDIQAICRRYGEKLKKQTTVDPRELERKRQEAEARARAEMEKLKAEATAVQAELQRKATMPQVQREQLLWNLVAQGIADLEQRQRDALAKGDAAEGARLAQDVAALRQREQEIYGQVEGLFGPARDGRVLELITVSERARLKDLERRAGEVKKGLQGEVASLEEQQRTSSGYGLEAGLFIAFGASAEICAMNDPVFGNVKVAIAEKINEAARGTARNATLKSKLDALVDQLRATGKPQASYPFNVYIDAAYNLLLPAELNDLVERAVRERDPERAREAARFIAEAALRDLARAMNLGDGQSPEVLSTLSDIYNSGEALSGEALEAFLTATSASRYWFRKDLPVAELNRAFTDRFLLPMSELRLVVSVPHDGDLAKVMVFRHAGEVQFRGFEAKKPTTVYELLRPDSAFSALLMEKHLRVWVAESKGGPRAAALG